MAVNLRCPQVYLAENRPGIVTAMHFNSAGIYYEQEEPCVLDSWRDGLALAASLRSSLERFSFRKANLRDAKKTDWPSYRASRCRSVREFESLYMRIHVRALNEAGLFYDAYAEPPGESDITLHVTLNRHARDEEISRQLLKVFDVCHRLSADSL
jgi:hypothetical protein